MPAGYSRFPKMLLITEICSTGFSISDAVLKGLVEAILEISCAQFLTLIAFVFSLPIFLASLPSLPPFYFSRLCSRYAIRGEVGVVLQYHIDITR